MKNSNPNYKNTNPTTNNSNLDHNNTNEKKWKKRNKDKKISSCSSTCSSFYNLFFLNQTQHPRTQTHHKSTKEKKKQIIISHSLIDEPEFSHSFLTRTTLSVSRPKQHDTQNQDQLSRSQDPNSMTHKTNPSKTQQDPNGMTNMIDLKKSAAALVVEVDSLEVDSLGSAKKRGADLTHHAPSIWPKVTEIELHYGRDGGWGRSNPPRTAGLISFSLSL